MEFWVIRAERACQEVMPDIVLVLDEVMDNLQVMLDKMFMVRRYTKLGSCNITLDMLLSRLLYKNLNFN